MIFMLFNFCRLNKSIPCLKKVPFFSLKKNHVKHTTTPESKRGKKNKRNILMDGYLCYVWKQKKKHDKNNNIKKQTNRSIRRKKTIEYSILSYN